MQKSKDKDHLNSLEKLVEFFFKHQLQVKMFHFQTKQYSAHKASDSYLEKFEKNMDQFSEVAQGIFGRLRQKQISINFNTATDQTIVSILDDYVTNLTKIEDYFGNLTELTTIRDQMIADTQQFKYLLTFK